jgi:hypothetical protein
MARICILLIVVCCIAMLVQGCMLVAVGAGAAGTVAYIKGDLEAVEAVSLNDTYRATEKAVEEMKLLVISKRKDSLGAVFKLRDTADKKITIKLTPSNESTTKISIRVGTFGNEAKSQMIYEKIKENI